MFGLGKKETPYGAIIDVHSGSVGVSLVVSDHTKPNPEIIFTHREYIKIRENPDTAGLIRALRHALFAASLQLSQEGMRALASYDEDAYVSKVMFVCGAPWANTVTRFIHVEDTEPFLVSEDRVRALIEEAERRDEEELRTSSLLKELNISLVERAVINTAINGYLVHEPYGKMGSELSLAHISGLVPQAILDAVLDVEHKLLPRASHVAHTFALVLFCMVRDLYPKTRHALLLDISGEATELAIMQDEVLMETCVFPFGAHTFARMVALELNTFPDEALTHMREFGPSTPEPIAAAIRTTMEHYSRELLEAVSLLENRYTIPHQWYLLSSRDLGSFFEPLITTTATPYSGQHGSVCSLNVDLTKDAVTSQKDAFFVLESRFFHKMHTCGEMF